MVFDTSCVHHLPHVVSAIILLASVIRSKYQSCAVVLFHLVVGIFITVCPSVIFGPIVIGEFDELHGSLQRFSGAFHLGFALFHHKINASGAIVDPIVYFVKALSAAFLTLTHLFFAYHLYETKARGIHLSSNFLCCVLLIEGAWAVAEVHHFIYQARSSVADQIDAMCKRTQRWIEGRTSLAAHSLLWIDSAVIFASVVFSFAFSRDILKPLIRRDFPIDDFHVLFVHDIACYSLAPAIISLFASQFPIKNQISYISQRLLTQGIVCLLHVRGHFYSGIYTSAHLPSFIASFFYLALLSCIYLRVRNEVDSGAEEAGPTSAASKKSSKAN